MTYKKNPYGEDGYFSNVHYDEREPVSQMV